MSLYVELKRRNVIRVAAAYLVASWLLIEMSSVALEAFGAPGWVPKTVGLLLAAGFPLALVFSWVYEMTPEGIKRESEVDRTTSITPATGRRLDLATMALLVAAVALFLSESLWRNPEPAPGPGPAAVTDAQGDSGSKAEEISVAVLPFTNLSADESNAYFADGISEEILNLLADIRDLSVASRTSAFAFKDTRQSIPEIARALGVRYVLEGSVRKAGEQVRITAQLIDAANDRHLWSQNYDRTLDDIFAIQDEIAGAIGKALQVELLGEGGKKVTAETIDTNLYADFLQARHLLRRRNSESMAKALALLIDVVESEPEFARGHVVLAEAYLLNGLEATGAVSLEIGLAQGRYHAEAARKLDPELGGVYQVVGLLTLLEGDTVQGMALYDRAIELEPGEPRPYHWRGITYGSAGYLERARQDLERAVGLEPDNANANGELATIVYALGDEARAMELADRQVALGNPEDGHVTAALFELAEGNVDAAAARFSTAANRIDALRNEYFEALIAAARDPEAGALGKFLIWPSEIQENTGALSCGLVVLGRYEAFLDLVDQGMDDLGDCRMIWSPRFQALRSDPRFVELMDRFGHADYWRRYGPPPDCRVEGDTFRCGLGDGAG